MADRYTHHADCYHDHHACAVSQVQRLRRRLAVACAEVERLEAVAEAARSLLSICVELVPSPEAHLGARMGRLGLALAAIDEEEGT